MYVHGLACSLECSEASAGAFGLTSFSPFLLLGGEAGCVGRVARIAAEPVSTNCAPRRLKLMPPEARSTGTNQLPSSRQPLRNDGHDLIDDDYFVVP